MDFSLTLRAEEERIVLNVEEETVENKVSLWIAPPSFISWAILFRDFLRLLYWFPHTQTLAESTLDFFNEPYIMPGETETETQFSLQPHEEENIAGAELLVWQPSHPNEPALSIQEGAALTFINVLGLGLFQYSDSSLFLHSDALDAEDFSQYHGELMRVEDKSRALGVQALWVTPEIQRLLIVSRVYDLGLPEPETIPQPLLFAAKEKVLTPWKQGKLEKLVYFLSEHEKLWSQKFHMAPKNSEESFVALQNWIFLLNLFGFLDRFLEGTLPTRMSNPIGPFISFLLEHFYIMQWESDLWPVRRSALEEIYRKLIPLLILENP